MSAGTVEEKQGKPPNSYELIVNGREKVVHQKKQTYRDIAKLAYPDADFEKFQYTITYFKGEHDHKEGDLVEGESVNVKDGMVFNVRRSDKS
ncbi:multiubiquitin domain-containing protein [Rhizobium leguminosarum]|nr:multiubiquitin domain-containing protein [Rhizobium leguminosarum]